MASNSFLRRMQDHLKRGFYETCPRELLLTYLSGKFYPSHLPRKEVDVASSKKPTRWKYSGLDHTDTGEELTRLFVPLPTDEYHAMQKEKYFFMPLAEDADDVRYYRVGTQVILTKWVIPEAGGSSGSKASLKETGHRFLDHVVNATFRHKWRFLFRAAESFVQHELLAYLFLPSRLVDMKKWLRL